MPRDEPTEHRGDGHSPGEIDLLPHSAGLVRALLSREIVEAGGATPHADWLHARYVEIAPVIIPDVLRCVGATGSLSEDTREHIRSSARTFRTDRVPLTVVVRGGVPALRAFAALLQTLDEPLTARQTSAVMGRASMIAWELSALWLEAWLEPPVDPDIDGSSLTIEAAASTLPDDASTMEPVALEMAALAAEGLSTEQIAAATAYSPQAVTWHLGRLMRAWKVGNRSALISVGFLRGVLVRRRGGPPGA